MSHSISQKNKKKSKSNKGVTSEIVEFDVGLGPVSKKLGVVRVNLDGLSVEIGGQLVVVVDKCFLGLLFEIGCHLGL